MEDRKTYLKFCITADAFQLEELLRGLRGDAEALQDRIDEVEMFLAHRPDLKAEESAAPEKPKRGKLKAALMEFDELRDTKNKVVLFLGKASAEMLVKFNAGLQLNHGLTTATMESWSKVDAQNAMAVIRGLEMNLSQILDTSKPPF